LQQPKTVRDIRERTREKTKTCHSLAKGQNESGKGLLFKRKFKFSDFPSFFRIKVKKIMWITFGFEFLCSLLLLLVKYGKYFAEI
jgi:hypothetical protein